MLLLPRVLIPFFCSLLVSAFTTTLQVPDSSQAQLLAPPPNRGGGKQPDQEKCPPCFNCMLPMFECKQFSTCNEYTGQCDCISGFGGMDCSDPVCGALSDGNNHRPLRGENQTTCDCKPGWSGINCNICQDNSVCDAFMPDPGLKGTCYKQGLIINKLHQMCDVTNKKIVAILNGKKPQVTFSCNKTQENCNFQFWIEEKESFYCDLNQCNLDYDLATNTSHYRCKDVACKCLPGRMLCGESGSIDISDFLTETIKGPGDFSCNVAERNCKFSEPSMNDLILSVFGDPYITLHCTAGECVHYSEIPGYFSPPKKAFSLYNYFLIAATFIGIICLSIVIGFYIKQSPLFGDAPISLPKDDNDSSSSSSTGTSNDLTNSTLISSHIPVSLTFKGIGYKVKGRTILEDSFGIVKPREMLAIMGGSGAGKTTLIDILAGKNKDGEKSGKILINGQQLTFKDYKKIIGFVDQEDYLIPTLTVYETVLNSALLRLPRNMSTQAKKIRVLEVLDELRILKIKDRLIGSDFERGISGGEKRRVAIACELVTSPSILFLDEPTSGLDSYNAKKVIECLVRLSRDYERTIIFTIHQPRSNIVAMFDKLLLLSEGKIVYSGDMLKCAEFFGEYGFKCPSGYNIADYLIDITSDTKHNKPTLGRGGIDIENVDHENEEEEDHHHDYDRLLTRQDSQLETTDEWAHYAQHRDELANTLTQSQTLQKKVLTIFRDSIFAEEMLEEIENINQNYINPNNSNNNKLFIKQGINQASIYQQIIILSSRTFKNLYRNPRLLMTQYLLSIFMGCFVGILYYDITIDISGFQNRLGLFFFILSFFGFSTLTGLYSFSIERIVFMRERSNNYYSTFSYYLTKILCDVLPLRIFPPIILLSIIYPLVGLRMEENGFLISCLSLILFNLATSLEILIVGILIPDNGNATLIGVLILLFSMLFSGLFINIKNHETVSSFINNSYWNLNNLKYLSTFHYGYESLIINEVKKLVLRETKYGLKIEIPGATILSTFGFNVGGMWEDLIFLSVWCGIFLIMGFLCLHYFVIEKR